jgi:hypothetical protein
MQLFEDVNLKSKMTKEDKILFANKLKELSKTIGFKISARGWAYQLEVEGLITKAEFDRVESIINLCRDKGYLPIDFVAEEEGRRFSGVETPETKTPIETMGSWVRGALRAENYYTPDWWDSEKYYIQMVVEKIDLKTLFEPVCKKYHIPIATSKGWSSKLQRATYSQRYAKAEEKGLQSVLLYCGDHDPDGLRISSFLKSNLEDLKNIVWSNDTKGYDPQNLIIERFGLDADFIKEHELSWIENLITGSGKNLASPNHKNFHMEYVQNYIKTFGIRKCEANALVTMPSIARDFVEESIIKYLGNDAINRFNKRWYKIKKEFNDFREETGLDESLKEALKTIEDSLE